jgi:hypothetical protein
MAAQSRIRADRRHELKTTVLPFILRGVKLLDRLRDVPARNAPGGGGVWPVTCRRTSPPRRTLSLEELNQAFARSSAARHAADSSSTCPGLERSGSCADRLCAG